MAEEKKKKTKITFKKGIHTVNIPYMPPFGLVEVLYKSGREVMDRFNLPKKFGYTIVCTIHQDKKGRGYDLTEVKIHK